MEQQSITGIGMSDAQLPMCSWGLQTAILNESISQAVGPTHSGCQCAWGFETGLTSENIRELLELHATADMTVYNIADVHALSAGAVIIHACTVGVAQWYNHCQSRCTERCTCVPLLVCIGTCNHVSDGVHTDFLVNIVACYPISYGVHTDL